MTKQTDKPEVTQADREAAASAYYAWISGNPVMRDKMLMGKADDHSMVQAFARHRQQALAQYIASVDEPEEVNPFDPAILAAATEVASRLPKGMASTAISAAEGDLIERLKKGVPLEGLAEDNNTELFDTVNADETMWEAAEALTNLQAENEALRQRVEKLTEALTPSAETKAAYIAEFYFDLPEVDEDGEGYSRRCYVPWVTIKEIMVAIRARAALETEKNGG